MILSEKGSYVIPQKSFVVRILSDTPRQKFSPDLELDAAAAFLSPFLLRRTA